MLLQLDTSKEIPPNEEVFKEMKVEGEKKEEKPKLKFPPHLKYVFLERKKGKYVIISSYISELEQEKLVKVLKDKKEEIGLTIFDPKGISLSFCMHKIMLEKEFKPIAQTQRKLKPTMKEVVRKEALKLLEAGMTYPISNSVQVSPMQVVPKKWGMTIITNEKNELIQFP